MKLLVAAFALVLVAACSEIPQDAHKSFAGESEMKGHADATALAKRTETQNEYLRMKE